MYQVVTEMYVTEIGWNQIVMYISKSQPVVELHFVLLSLARHRAATVLGKAKGGVVTCKSERESSGRAI